MNRERYLALEVQHAHRYDFGVPDDFVSSLQTFRTADTETVK